MSAKVLVTLTATNRLLNSAYFWPKKGKAFVKLSRCPSGNTNYIYRRNSAKVSYGAKSNLVAWLKILRKVRAIIFIIHLSDSIACLVLIFSWFLTHMFYNYLAFNRQLTYIIEYTYIKAFFRLNDH